MQIKLRALTRGNPKELVTVIEIGWENLLSCAQLLVKPNSIIIKDNLLYAERIDGLQVKINILAKNLTEFWATYIETRLH